MERGVLVQRSTDDHLALYVDAVDLKDSLCDIETDCRNRLHNWLLRIVGALAAPNIHGTHVPVEEPSTASQADSCTAPIILIIRSPRRRGRAASATRRGRAP